MKILASKLKVMTNRYLNCRLITKTNNNRITIENNVLRIILCNSFFKYSVLSADVIMEKPSGNEVFMSSISALIFVAYLRVFTFFSA